MITIAICDDEEYFKNKILNLLKIYFSNKNIDYEVDVFDSGMQLIKLEDRVSNYDLIFLDIHMPELNGIEIAKRIRNYTQDTHIVFISSYLEYSLEGYKVNAIRYLLKDGDEFELSFDECLDTIVTKMDQAKIKQIFEFREGKREVQFDNIMYIESNLHKLTFYIMEDEVVKYSMYEKLDIIEGKMQMGSFCRIHKSYLVNLKYIEDMQRSKVILINGQELNTSKARYKDVLIQFLALKQVS
jgi:two-component system, LytTR family, response regulator LytT